jgi:hypothetical protein
MNTLPIIILLITISLTLLLIKIFNINRLINQFEIFILVLCLIWFILYKYSKNKDIDIIENNIIYYSIILLLIYGIIHYIIEIYKVGITTPQGIILIGIIILLFIIIYFSNSIGKEINSL